MFDILIRAFRPSDAPTLEEWRRSYDKGEIELPYGYDADGVETDVAMDANGSPIAALTGTMIDKLEVNGELAVALDFVKNADIKGTDLLAALFALQNAILRRAGATGAREAVIAVPTEEKQYIGILKRCGFEETANNCTILRRALR